MTTSDRYDSEADTRKHQRVVTVLISQVVRQLIVRGNEHDDSKLAAPEKPVFDEYTPKLKHSTYGSAEYKGFLDGMGEGLAHHYAHNRHHPEHFPDGISGMTLVDIVEMLCDWKAATLRHADGDLDKSLRIQAERFGIEPQLMRVLYNTAHEQGWL